MGHACQHAGAPTVAAQARSCHNASKRTHPGLSLSNPTLSQGRRDLPEELVQEHPSLQNPDATQCAGSISSPEPSPRTSGALPPITGDLGSAQLSPGRVMSSHTTTTATTTTATSGSTGLGPPNLARVSISQMSHEALDKTAHGGEASAARRFCPARPATACCLDAAGRALAPRAPIAVPHSRWIHTLRHAAF